MKKVTILFAVLLAICAITVVPAFAASNQPQDGLKSFTIDGVGTSFIPNGIDFASSVGTDAMKNIETQYDLTSSGGDSSHYARLIVYKDTRDLGPALALVDLVELKPELVTLMSNMGQKLVSKKLEENGAKLIEWLPASKSLVQKHNGVQFGARLTLSDKLPMPMFAAIAVYPQDGKLTGIALMCPDTDRLYWQPVFKQILNSATATQT